MYLIDILTEKNARKRMEREVQKLRRELKQTTEIKDQENKAQVQQLASTGAVARKHRRSSSQAQAQVIERPKKQLAAAKQ